MRVPYAKLAAFAALALGASIAVAQIADEPEDRTSAATEVAPAAEPLDAPDPGSGREPLPLATERYAKSWAVVVGVNYKGRTDAGEFLKPLETAENDARAVAQTLSEIYGYRPEATPDHEQTLFLLLGEEATEAKINDALVTLKTAGENDSVLFYFAGHGVRFAGGSHDRGAIYPYDVSFSTDGRPVAHRLRLHSDLLAAIHESKARHRLIVLDSCHSGEIFNASAQPRSEAVNHSAAETLHQRCLQVVASCSDIQVASDGTGPHSPFTQALLEALKSPPRAEWVTTNELFYFMRPRLETRVRQTPDCRNFQLDGDRDSNDSGGEFRFYVACSESDLRKYRTQSHDPVLLQATVAGEHGKWWFEAMPWFIPAFRAEILNERDATRGDARWVTRDELRSMAVRLLDKRRAELNDYRRRHFELLWEMDRRGQDLRDTLTLIREDLTKLVAEGVKPAPDLSPAEPATPRRDYTAENLHFLAVVKHRLGDRDAETAYRRALKAYDERKGNRPQEQVAAQGDHLKALCLADFAEYLFKVARDSREAARRFREADDELGGAGPAPFRVYVKAREADAWLELNRWADADAALKIATDSARVFDLHEPQALSAYAFSRCGWARMIQWKIQEARTWFARSNEILRGMMDENGSAKWTAARSAGEFVGPSSPGPAPGAPVLAAKESASEEDVQDRGASNRWASIEQRAASNEAVFEVPDYVRRSKDVDAQTLYFHNLHGLAMVLRFSDPQSDGAQAAVQYRSLARELEAALARVRAEQAGLQEDAESGLMIRYVNTLERLGDCSLFGNPTLRDPDEAADDYRRAEARAHLTTDRREDRRARLLYKRAIALSLPSPSRDLELAQALCAAGDAVLGEGSATTEDGTTGSAVVGANPRSAADADTLRQVTPHIVALLRSTSFGEVDRAAQSKAAAKLRQSVDELRRDLGAKLHRDQLEICLLATHILLEFGGETDRLLLRSDADLLTDLCRSNLSPYSVEIDDEESLDRSESLAYLRPYYDAVFRARLRIDDRQVHELLELHWEATQGVCYQKPNHPLPVLAVYVLDGRCHILLDLPRGGGHYAALSNTVEDLRSTSHFRPLPLPNEIARALQRWRLERGATGPANAAGDAVIECRWEDPLYNVNVENANVVETVHPVSTGAPRTPTAPVRRRFPFELPAGFSEPDPAPAPQTASAP